MVSRQEETYQSRQEMRRAARCNVKVTIPAKQWMAWMPLEPARMWALSDQKQQRKKEKKEERTTKLCHTRMLPHMDEPSTPLNVPVCQSNEKRGGGFRHTPKRRVRPHSGAHEATAQHPESALSCEGRAVLPASVDGHDTVHPNNAVCRVDEQGQPSLSLSLSQSGQLR